MPGFRPHFLAQPIFAAAICAIVAAGCGQGEPLGLADDVREAFAEDRMDRIYDRLAPEVQNQIQIERSRELHRFDQAEPAQRRVILTQMNQQMWWDEDWKVLKDRDDLEEVTASDIYRSRYAPHYATTERFEQRAESLLRTGFDRSFAGDPEWGAAQVEYTNALDDRLVILLVQRDGDWYVTNVEVRGFPLRSQEQVRASEDAEH